jgi:hypothetical protein
MKSDGSMTSDTYATAGTTQRTTKVTACKASMRLDMINYPFLLNPEPNFASCNVQATLYSASCEMESISFLLEALRPPPVSEVVWKAGSCRMLPEMTLDAMNCLTYNCCSIYMFIENTPTIVDQDPGQRQSESNNARTMFDYQF